MYEFHILLISNVPDIGIMVRMFANGPEDLGSIPGLVIQKKKKKKKEKKKRYFMPPCLTLSIIKYGSKVKWSNPGKRVVPSPHLHVVAIEKGALRSPSTMVTNLPFFDYQKPLTRKWKFGSWIFAYLLIIAFIRFKINCIPSFKLATSFVFQVWNEF